MPRIGATVTRTDRDEYEIRTLLTKNTVTLGAWARELPAHVNISVDVSLPPGSYDVVVFSDDGRVLDESECPCLGTECETDSLGCALTCYIFPLNVLCPRCAYCFLFSD